LVFFFILLVLPICWRSVLVAISSVAVLPLVIFTALLVIPLPSAFRQCSGFTSRFLPHLGALSRTSSSRAPATPAPGTSTAACTSCLETSGAALSSRSSRSGTCGTLRLLRG
jgi:hypothetical protein